MNILRLKSLFIFITVIFFLGSFFVVDVWSQCLVTKKQFFKSFNETANSANVLSLKIDKCSKIKDNYLTCFCEPDSVLSIMLFRLADLNFKDGKVYESITILRDAIYYCSLFNKQTQRYYQLNAYYTMGIYYKKLADYQNSIIYFDRVCYHARRSNGGNTLALKAFEQIAYLKFYQGDYQMALKVSETGIVVAQQNNDSLAYAKLLIQKAQSQIYLRLFNEAKLTLDKASGIFDKLSSDLINLSQISSLRAQLSVRRQDFITAEKFLKDAIFNTKSQLNQIHCSRNLLELGLLYDEKLKNPAEAIRTYRQGILKLRSTYDPYLLCAFYVNIGLVYWRMSKFDTSLYFYQQALNTAPIGFTSKEVSHNPSLAQLKLVNQDYYIFQLLANKGLSQLDLYKQTKEASILKAAQQTFLLADFMIDQMRRNQSEDKSKLYWRGMSKEVYRDAIETCYLLNDVDKAFYFFEKSRAILLHDKLKNATARNYLSPVQQQQETKLNYEISSLKQQLAGYENTSSEYRDAIQKLYTTEKIHTKFIQEIEKKNPKYYQYKYNTSVSSLPEVKKKILSPDQTLVEYFYYDEDVYIFSVTQRNTKVYKLAFPEFPKVVKELTSHISNKSKLNQHYKDYVHYANLLYSKLFKPLKIATKKVIIANDEYFIPFETLLSNPNDPNSFLIKNHIFSYIYSVSVTGATTNNQPSIADNMLAMAPVDFETTLKKASLHGSDKSLSKIEAYFTSAQILCGKDAAKNNFLARCPAYSIIHLYTHAASDTISESSKIYFSDAAMDLNELEHLPKLNTKLIMLSACKTGAGKKYDGEGVFSFSRAFAAAGIPATITNLWDIDNHATYFISEKFYHHLHNNLPFDEALHQAKLDYLEVADTELRLPYYWGPSVLIGSSGRLSQQSSPKWYLLPALGFIVIIMIVLIYFNVSAKKARLYNLKQPAP